MKNCWRTDDKKTDWLNPGKYIAIRISDTTIKFYPWPKFRARDIRENLNRKKPLEGLR